MDREDRRTQVCKRCDRLLDRVRNVVQLEVEKDRHLALGKPENAVVAMRAEELEPELQARGDSPDVARDRCCPVNVRRVDRNEDRSHAGSSSSSTGWALGAGAEARLRS